MSNIEKIVNLAGQQHGIFATFQLKDLGIATGSIDCLLKNPIISQLDRGVYSLIGSNNSWHSKALTHVFRAGPQAMLSHESALINLELLNEKFLSLRNGQGVSYHATLPRYSRRRINSSLHRSVYENKILKRTVVNAIPQVPVECAIIESAQHLPTKIFSSVADNAIRRELTSAKKIQATLNSLHSGPGRSKSRVKNILEGYLISLAEYKKIESALEARIFRILSQITTEKIIPQYKVGHYRIDLAIPSLKIAVEIDGFAYHADRIAFDADKNRQNYIVARGWTVLRFTATQSNDEIRSQLEKLLVLGR